MNQLIETLAEDTAIATGAFAQSTVVPIDNEPTPTLIVEPPLVRWPRPSCSSRTGGELAPPRLDLRPPAGGCRPGVLSRGLSAYLPHSAARTKGTPW